MNKGASDTSAAVREPPLSAELRDQSDRIWTGLHAHPFLRELAQGVLPLEKFRFFVEQDIMYLPDFARCIAMGAAKSATEAGTWPTPLTSGPTSPAAMGGRPGAPVSTRAPPAP